MKFKLFIATTLAAGLALTSCEDLVFGDAFLEKPLSSDKTMADVYSAKVYAEQALAQAYNCLPDFMSQNGRLGWLMMESITDIGECIKAGGSIYHKGAYNAASVGSGVFDINANSDSNGAFSENIRKAYSFIANVDAVPDMTDEEKKIRKAEAKVLIGIQYSQAFRYLGGLPWIPGAFNPSDDMTMPRLTAEETVNKICALLDEAAADLPWSTSMEDDGRMTAASAIALKHRVLLFAASPLLNSDAPYLEGEASTKLMTWLGDYQSSRWQAALDAGLEFLEMNESNGGFYTLHNKATAEGDEPRDHFAGGYFQRYNGETLIASRRLCQWQVNGCKFMDQLRFGVLVPTMRLMEAYEFADGTPFSWDKIGGTVTETYDDGTAKAVVGGDPYFNADGSYKRDARIYETLGVNGDRYQGRKLEGYNTVTGDKGKESWDNPGNTWKGNGGSGAGMRKFRRDWSTEIVGRPYNCPLLRLPEVYLGIAEAMNELGIANTPDKFGRTAYDYINLVRERAGVADVDQAKYPEGQALLDYILEERVREFAFEEVRYFDLVRHKRYDLWSHKLDRYETIQQTDKTYTYTILRDAKYENGNVRLWLADAEACPKYYFSAFPVSEVNKGYGLVQNPGWE